MTRRSFFRSSSSGGGDGGGNKKRDVDLQLRPQQRASPPAIHHETQGPRPVTIFPSQRHALASRDVNEFHPIPDIMDDHPLQYSVSKQPLHKSQKLRYETDAAIHQSDLSHYDYASQLNGIVDTEMIQHETYQQEDPTNMLLHRRRGGGQEQYLVSAVENAVDEIWRCRIDDFRSASLAIQNLRLAILAEWENRQLNDRENKGTMASKIYNSSSKISYDPSDTFLSLQGATLRFHAQFEFMKAERDADQLSRKIGAQQQTGEESSVAADSTTVTTNCQSLNGVEWELTEQYAWEVWEEAIRASAALAHACVGPAWRRQLKLRRQFVRERLPRQQFGDGMSTNSGDLNMSSSSFSPEIANLPSLGGRSSVCETSVDSSILEPPTDVLELVSCNIPEVLPAAMIRFASSILETSIPPLRSKHTKIYWESTEKGGVVPEGIESLLSSLDQHLQDERRWLRRRKRLGDAQR